MINIVGDTRKVKELDWKHFWDVFEEYSDTSKNWSASTASSQSVQGNDPMAVQFRDVTSDIRKYSSWKAFQELFRVFDSLVPWNPKGK
jgi:hypothetical protein